MYPTEDQRTAPENMKEMLVPTFCGLSLPDKILVSVMGKENAGAFLRKREEYYDEWRFKQFSNESFPIAQLNSLMEEAGEPPVQLHLDRFRLRNEVKCSAQANEKAICMNNELKKDIGLK